MSKEKYTHTHTHTHTHTLSLLLTYTTNLVGNVVPDIRNIPHCEEGVKAGTFLTFMGIGFIGETIMMGNCSQKHLETNNEILQNIKENIRHLFG